VSKRILVREYSIPISDESERILQSWWDSMKENEELRTAYMAQRFEDLLLVPGNDDADKEALHRLWQFFKASAATGKTREDFLFWECQAFALMTALGRKKAWHPELYLKPHNDGRETG